MPTTSYHDEPIPGIDGRWICANLIAERLSARLCFLSDAICILQEALRRGLLRSQTQACTTFRLVERLEWDGLQLVLRDSDAGWFVEVAHRQTGEPLEANLYLWWPDCDRLWPAGPCAAPGTAQPPSDTNSPVLMNGMPFTMPASTPSSPPEPVKKYRPIGRHPDWRKIIDRSTPLIETNGPWPNANRAATEILKKHTDLTIDPDALRKGIPKYFPECIGLDSKE